jgi:SAM-dependent methyltransferase
MTSTTELKPRTATTNGRLWGARAAEWSELQEPLFRPVYEAVFMRANLKPGMHYLDVGCGSGLAMQMAAQLGAKASGIDAAQSLLDIAKTRSPGADLQLGDLEELPFGNGRFDLVTGFNAFQYAGNPVRALGEAKRVAKPGASVTIVTWGPPEGMQAASLVAALRPVLPPPPPGAPGPFALSDETALRGFAAQAGLVPGEMFDVESPWHYASLDHGLRGLKSAGVGVRAIEHSGEDKVDDVHRQALAPFAQSDGSYRIAATFRCLMTRA